MRGLTLNGQQDVFRGLTPTMRVLTDEEIYDAAATPGRRLGDYSLMRKPQRGVPLGVQYLGLNSAHWAPLVSEF